MKSLVSQSKRIYKDNKLTTLGSAVYHGKNVTLCGINLSVGIVKRALLYALENYVKALDSIHHHTKTYNGMLPSGTHVTFNYKTFNGTSSHQAGHMLHGLVMKDSKALIKKIKRNPHVLTCSYSQLNCLGLAIVNTRILIDHQNESYGLATYTTLLMAIDPLTSKTSILDSPKDLNTRNHLTEKQKKAINDAKSTRNVPVSLKTITTKSGSKAYRTAINMEVPSNDIAVNDCIMFYMAVDQALDDHKLSTNMQFLSGHNININVRDLCSNLGQRVTETFFSNDFESTMINVMNKVMDQPAKLILTSVQAESLYNISVIAIQIAKKSNQNLDASAITSLTSLLNNIEQYCIHHSPNLLEEPNKSMDDSIKDMTKDGQLSTIGYVSFGGSNEVHLCALNLNLKTFRKLVLTSLKLYPIIFKAFKNHSFNKKIRLPNRKSYDFKGRTRGGLIERLKPLMDNHFYHQITVPIKRSVKELKNKKSKILVLDKHQILAMSKALKVISLVDSGLDIMDDYHIYFESISLTMQLYNKLSK